MGCFFQSSGKIELLKDLFYLFPIDLQIRVLKKIFNLIDMKKLNISLSDMKSILGGYIHSLSIPITIVFRYLELKVNDRDANMTDAIMMSILKNRDDYEDWIYIKYMLTPCNGRVKESFDGDTYFNFNGKIQHCDVLGKNVLRLYLYRNQINYGEMLTNYNNKYYDNIQRYIFLDFNDDEYKQYIEKDCLIFDFLQECDDRVRIMARCYRIKMDDVN